MLLLDEPGGYGSTDSTNCDAVLLGSWGNNISTPDQFRRLPAMVVMDVVLLVALVLGFPLQLPSSWKPRRSLSRNLR